MRIHHPFSLGGSCPGRTVVRLTGLILASVLTFGSLPGGSVAYGQGGGGGNGGGGGGGGTGGGGNNGGQAFSQPAGVAVDAAGVLKVQRFDAKLANQRLVAARQLAAAGDNDLFAPSPARRVSLTRLERALATRIDAGQPVDDAMAAMAGLTSIERVYCLPETGDVVVEGPAGGFVADPTERFVNIQTAAPCVLLEDVAVALRAFPPSAAPTPEIFCSIDPTTEGLQRMQAFLTRVGGRATPGDTAAIVGGLRDSLGYQTVSVGGIPATTHFARVIVEADYRMKLIGIGLERPPIAMRSYVARTNPAMVAAGALQRWYFEPSYDSVAVADDGMAMSIAGGTVRLVGESERVENDGSRRAAGRTNRASQLWCQDFTENFGKIAAAERVYAELAQVIDLAIVAAYIQKADFYGKTNWTIPTLGSESSLPVADGPPIAQVETAVNAIWRGNRLMTPLGGGVHIAPSRAISGEAVADGGQTLTTARGRAAGGAIVERWWWD